MGIRMPPATPTETTEKPASSASCACPNNDFLSSTHLKWVIRTLLAYFLLRLLYLAVNVSSFVPPDEVTHAGLCRIFSTALLSPENSPQTYEFGLVTNIPWLYYWTMGKLLHLNVFGLPDLVFLRLLNIPLAFGTVWYSLRLLRLLTSNRLIQLLLVIVITNISMFSLLSASVSSDNLTNLCASMAIFYLFAFFKERSGGLLLASILCQLAGTLTKVTFLPLALVLGLLLFVHEFSDLRGIPAATTTYFRKASRRAWLSALAILVALGLNIQLYAGNYLNYGTLNPGLAQVCPKDAMQYRIAARETIFKEYSEGRISYMDALVMAGRIKHPGDKSDTFYLLMNYENLKRSPQLWMGPLEYTGVWLENMAGSIFGIKGHLPMFKDFRYVMPIYLGIALALLGFLTRWRPRESGWLPLYLAVIVCYYAGYLLYKVNYNAYLYYGTPGITLQGRYLFPVIAPICVLSCHYLLHLFRPNYIRVPLALTLSLMFIAYDFPWFLMHATPEWYTWMPR
jgi:hypothetical protein